MPKDCFMPDRIPFEFFGRGAGINLSGHRSGCARLLLFLKLQRHLPGTLLPAVCLCYSEKISARIATDPKHSSGPSFQESCSNL
jgi:hypothetical protein